MPGCAVLRARMSQTSGSSVPRRPAIVTETLDRETCRFEPPHRHAHWKGAERQLEAVLDRAAAAALDVSLFERRQPAASILVNRLDERQVPAARRRSAQLHLIAVFASIGHVGNEIETKCPTLFENSRNRGERSDEIAIAQHRLQNTVRREHQLKAVARKWQHPNVAARLRRHHPAAGAETSSLLRVFRCARQHRVGSIDPDQPYSRSRQRSRDSPGAAAELEHGPGRSHGEAPPERHVASPQRARVLPVVKRRVLVPALPALQDESRPPIRDRELTRNDRSRARLNDPGVRDYRRRRECPRRRQA